MDDRKSQPTLVMIILMLLGISAVPKITGPDSSAPKVTDAKSADNDETASEPSRVPDALKKTANPDLAVLEPLIDLSDDGSLRRIEERPDTPKFDADGRKKLVKELVARVHKREGTVRAMIALVPDPVRTSVSAGF